MGWKASCIFIRDDSQRLLAEPPVHHRDQALLLASRLELPRLVPGGETTLEHGIYPGGSGDVFIACYEGLTWLGAEEGGGGNLVTGHRESALLQRCVSLFPQASVLALELHSVVNWWGYVLYERGQLRRAHAGSSDDGLLVDEGKLLEEERPHFRHSFVRDGERFFKPEDASLEESSLDAYGEELVFAVSARLLPAPLDRLPLETWPATVFRRERGLLERLRGVLRR